MGWYKLANEVEINLDFLRGLDAAFAVTLMDKDFINSLQIVQSHGLQF